MKTFSDKFETFASSLKTSDWSTLSSCFTSARRFGSGRDSQGNYDYGLSDMKGFLENAKSSSYAVSDALDALDDVLVYSAYASKYYTSKEPCGMNVFMTPSSLKGMQISKSDYGTNDTRLSNWRSFVVANGSFASAYSF